MKELSIEEKAKAYDELLKKLQEAKEDNDVCDERYCCVIDDIVPELKESEDERIRKELIDCIRHSAHNTPADKFNAWVAWLEKQGNKKDNLSVDFVLGYLGIKPAYKDGNAWCILLGDNIQEGICGFGGTKEEALVAFMKELIEKKGEQKHQYKSRPRYVGEEELLGAGKQELLKQELLKKENALKNSPFVEQRLVPKFEVGDVMRTLQEAADNITSGLPVVVSIDDDNEYYRCNNELIAIKDQDDYEYPPMNRIQKPAWSEEEQQNIDSIIAALTYCNENGVSDCFVDPDVLIVWLKSLRPQKQWKPSEDQIMALRWVLNHIPYDSHKEEISGLLEQLKKLRDE